MEMESDGVLMVGIWGLGGGGKTTLASTLYDEICSKFDGFCFLKDVREESRKHGLEELQEKVLSIVLKQKREELVGDVGRLIKRSFRHKKVLLVLDDVDHVDQLKGLAGSNAWFGIGSRIIITTRDKHLLNHHKVNVVYNISLLNDDEALQLFRKHAPRQNRPIKDYEMLSMDVVSYVGGLPLALKVLGSFLCDKDMSEWRSALVRLKDIPESDIVERLKISYDGLKPTEKELFLDIACYFRGYKKDKAMEILDACGFHPIIGVKVLIQKALISVSEAGEFDMHDLLGEMGHYIVQGENPKNPELHSRVWRLKDVETICARDATTENQRIEALLFDWHCHVPPRLPHVVANMKKLRWISCYNYPAASLPISFQPTKLCYLGLVDSLVEQLWEGYKHLPNLKVLDLTNSTHLVSTPDFEGLPCLERLILINCTSLIEMHPSIGYHECLIFLDIRSCESFETFPPIIRMRKLETLLLTGCPKFCKFPEIKRNMSNLVELSLRGSGVEMVPSSIGHYCTNLVSLDLRECKYLHSIEGNFRLLKHLKGLYLEGSDQLKSIPVEGLFDVECRLQLLSLSSTSLNNLYRGALSVEPLGLSRFLRRLSLGRCRLVDVDIISVFYEELSNLEVLDLSENKFSQLHSNLSQLPRLKYLNLSNCFNLVELPDLPSSIAILIAIGCSSLDIVGDFPTNHLKWLWKVALSSRNHCNVEKLLQALLQGNAIEDYFVSMHLYEDYIPIRGCKSGTFTLQLPWNWYNEFSGFLVYADHASLGKDVVIIMKDVMGWENEDDDMEVSNEDEERARVNHVCYISFASLRDTSWWNETHTTVSFFIQINTSLKVELVPRRNQGDESKERAKDITCSSEFWDEETPNRKTFEITHDARSSIKIKWCTDLHSDIFDALAAFPQHHGSPEELYDDMLEGLEHLAMNLTDSDIDVLFQKYETITIS